MLDRAAHPWRWIECCPDNCAGAGTDLLRCKPLGNVGALVDLVVFGYDWVNWQILSDQAHPLVGNQLHGCLCTLQVALGCDVRPCRCVTLHRANGEYHQNKK